MVNEIRIVGDKIEFEDNDLGDKKTLKELANRTDIFKYRKIGSYYTSRLAGGALEDSLVPVNQLDALPFIVPTSQNFDRIAINVTTAVAGNGRLGIYADNGDVYPGALILDAGEVDTGTTGVKEIIISLNLQPGLYWLARVFNAQPYIKGLSSTSLITIVGIDASLSGNPAVGWRVDHTYDVLPDPFTAGGSMLFGGRPVVFLRRAI